MVFLCRPVRCKYCRWACYFESVKQINDNRCAHSKTIFHLVQANAFDVHTLFSVHSIRNAFRAVRVCLYGVRTNE